MSVVNVQSTRGPSDKFAAYEIEELHLQDGKVNLTLDRAIVVAAANALFHSGNKALKSLASRLAKIGHVFDGNADVHECLGDGERAPIATYVYDVNGDALLEP